MDDSLDNTTAQRKAQLLQRFHGTIARATLKLQEMAPKPQLVTSTCTALPPASTPPTKAQVHVPASHTCPAPPPTPYPSQKRQLPHHSPISPPPPKKKKVMCAATPTKYPPPPPKVKQWLCMTSPHNDERILRVHEPTRDQSLNFQARASEPCTKRSPLLSKMMPAKPPCKEHIVTLDSMKQSNQNLQEAEPKKVATKQKVVILQGCKANVQPVKQDQGVRARLEAARKLRQETSLDQGVCATRLEAAPKVMQKRNQGVRARLEAARKVVPETSPDQGVCATRLEAAPKVMEKRNQKQRQRERKEARAALEAMEAGAQLVDDTSHDFLQLLNNTSSCFSQYGSNMDSAGHLCILLQGHIGPSNSIKEVHQNLQDAIKPKQVAVESKKLLLQGHKTSRQLAEQNQGVHAAIEAARKVMQDRKQKQQERERKEARAVLEAVETNAIVNDAYPDFLQLLNNMPCFSQYGSNMDSAGHFRILLEAR